MRKARSRKNNWNACSNRWPRVRGCGTEPRLTGKTYTNGDPAISYFYDQTTYNGLTITNGVGGRTGGRTRGVRSIPPNPTPAFAVHNPNWPWSSIGEKYSRRSTLVGRDLTGASTPMVFSMDLIDSLSPFAAAVDGIAVVSVV